jgi:hypothetical protein
MSAILTINNANNQVVAYLNNQQVYNKSTENNPPLKDTVDLSNKLIFGSNSLLIVGVNWDGSAIFKGNLSINGIVTPWEYQDSSSPNGLVWNQVFAIFQGAPVTINFSGLISGRSTNSYTESGYTLSGFNIYASYVDGVSGAFASDASTVFTFQKSDSTGFKINSLMLRNINESIGALTVVFTGNLIGGGTVTYAVTTKANSITYQTITFPDNFSILSSVVWTPQATVITNVNAEASE